VQATRLPFCNDRYQVLFNLLKTTILTTLQILPALSLIFHNCLRLGYLFLDALTLLGIGVSRHTPDVPRRVDHAGLLFRDMTPTLESPPLKAHNSGNTPHMTLVLIAASRGVPTTMQ
jgi:hypothetical protein